MTKNGRLAGMGGIAFGILMLGGLIVEKPTGRHI